MAHRLLHVSVDEQQARPFLKWAGGKRQLLAEIESYYPFSCRRIKKYAEPFVGGGAVLFDILNKYDLEAVYISDINVELINAYRAVRGAVEELVPWLARLEGEFLPLDREGRKAYYLAQRQRFNKIAITVGGKVNVEKAALLIFLNRTCFNGLFRVNRRGDFNVPMGVYKNPLICDEGNLRMVSKKLREVTIVCADYRSAADFIDANTFVYFDPPYRPLTSTANFTSYTAGSFDDAAQIELAAFVDAMHNKGAKVVVSNSDPKNTNCKDEFFDRIYAARNIHRVAANRMINCNREARGKIQELLISNF